MGRRNDTERHGEKLRQAQTTRQQRIGQIHTHIKTRRQNLPDSKVTATTPKTVDKAGQMESVPSALAALTIEPPVKTQKMIGTKIGDVPMSILSKGSLNIPHSTDVGQSVCLYTHTYMHRPSKCKKEDIDKCGYAYIETYAYTLNTGTDIDSDAMQTSDRMRSCDTDSEIDTDAMQTKI